MKCTHQVFSRRRVDRRLATHGGIHHAQQRRGHLDDANAAEPCRSDETCDVRDRSPADGHDGVTAGEPQLAQQVPQGRHDGQVLRGLAARQWTARDDVVVTTQNLHEGLRQRTHGGICHDQDLLGARQQIRDGADEVPTDQHVVRR